MERDTREIKKILAEFDAAYGDLLYESGLTERFIIEWNNKGMIGSPEDVRRELAQAGEDPHEVYISARLRSQLPETLTLPFDYGGLKVGIMSVGGELDLVNSNYR